MTVISSTTPTLTELMLLEDATIEVLELLLNVIEDLSKGVGLISLDDYRAFNEAPFVARVFIDEIRAGQRERGVEVK